MTEERVTPPLTLPFSLPTAARFEVSVWFHSSH